MPVKPEGVYQDGRGKWYVKVTVGRDPLTGRRAQVTKRGFRTAAEAARARRELLDQVARRQLRPVQRATTVNDLLDLYLDGIDADGHLAAKTRFDYRVSADKYVRPYLGPRRLGDLTGELIVAWQRHLAEKGGTKAGKPLAPNTVRLARAPLAGALKLAADKGMVAFNPMTLAPRPKPARSVPRHWSPEQARHFLALMEGDRSWPIWAFLLGCGLRIGELVWLRWANVDWERRGVRVVEFASALGHQLVPSTGKSRDAVRTVDLDDGLVDVLRRRQHLQSFERAGADPDAGYVFTHPDGNAYHPQYLSKLLARRSQELGLPRLTAHGLRHTSATLMLANGVPPKVAAERLGHADPTLFTNLYSHVTPTMQREAARLIGLALFAGPPSDGPHGESG